MAKVSIIIPVYNVENYLKEALDSVLAQTLQDLEMVCVNDGSTDNSLSILESYAAKDNRIKIISVANGGYGKAMNLGLDSASGEYIGIVEPDDYILTDMYENLYRCAKEHDLDIVKEDFYRFMTVDGKTYREYVPLSNYAEDYNVVLRPRKDTFAFNFTMNTWAGIYRREFLEANKIRHHETPGASYQDNGFWLQTFLYAERVMILDKTGYCCRRDNPNSSVRNPGKVYAINKEYDFIKEILQRDKSDWESLKGIYWRIRFLNYESTLRRIADSFKDEYLKFIADELKAGEQNKEFSKGDFDSREWARVQDVMSGTYHDDSDAAARLYLLQNSRSYKIGQFMTLLPRKIRDALKG